MADYISLDYTVENMENYPWDTEHDKNAAIHLVRELVPVVDVQPVVLCRDCKHFNPYPGDCTDGEIEGVCKRHNSIGVLVTDEDFCSDAERI